MWKIISSFFFFLVFNTHTNRLIGTEITKYWTRLKRQFLSVQDNKFRIWFNGRQNMKFGNCLPNEGKMLNVNSCPLSFVAIMNYCESIKTIKEVGRSVKIAEICSLSSRLHLFSMFSFFFAYIYLLHVENLFLVPCSRSLILLKHIYLLYKIQWHFLFFLFLFFVWLCDEFVSGNYFNLAERDWVCERERERKLKFKINCWLKSLCLLYVNHFIYCE